ncbi:hypothetical protein EV586_103672 [Tumebacillus sp. BK434]|uniref:hypothetical protein n=1 Tax=Tumebacillus sp. BK434 TaxID=2512169 RepID=UPI0010494FBA|nr:hypothetical protein [Tumebacillus sp. BK434]TCP56012.1 hypothetical protein EV586_103672 [Tumebacillus sp. BK434]
MKKTLAILSFAIAAVAVVGFQNVIIRGDVEQEAVIIRGDSLDSVDQLAVIIRGDSPRSLNNDHVPNEHSAIVRGKVLPSGNSVIIRGGFTA